MKNNPDNTKYFQYLFDLQASGHTNMFGAGAYLAAEMGLDKREAKEIVLYWMANYDELSKSLGIEA